MAMGLFQYGIAAGFMLAAAMGLMITGAVIANRMRMVRVALPDGDTGSGKIIWVKPKGNTFRLGLGKDARTYILEGLGLYGSGYGRFHIVHPRHGWNMRMPRDAEEIDDDTMRRLVISNPYSYEYAIKTNDVQDSLQANAGKQTDYGIWLLGLAVLTIFILGYIAYKLGNAGAA